MQAKKTAKKAQFLCSLDSKKTISEKLADIEVSLTGDVM